RRLGGARRLCFRLRRLGFLRRRAPRGADRLDLDLGQRGAETGLAAVAALRAPLADPDLVAANVPDHLRRHLHARREVGVAVAAGVFATYARRPVHELYHVSENGRSGGAGRALVFLNWPVALAALPMLAVVAADARSRVVSRLAIVAALLCAAVFWPGMVDQW